MKTDADKNFLSKVDDDNALGDASDEDLSALTLQIPSVWRNKVRESLSDTKSSD